MRATLMGCVIATKKYLATIYVVTTLQPFLKCYLMLLLYSRVTVPNVTFSNLEAQRFSLAKAKKIPNTPVKILHNFHAAR